MTDYSNKSTGEIVNDIEANRQSLLRNVEDLQNRLQPDQLWEMARTSLIDSGCGEFTRNMGRSLRDNPLPVALIGAGIAWMIAGQGGPSSDDIAAKGRDLTDRFRSGDDGANPVSRSAYPAARAAEPEHNIQAEHDIRGREVTQPALSDIDGSEGKSLAAKAKARLESGKEALGQAGQDAMARGEAWTDSLRSGAADVHDAARERWSEGKAQASEAVSAATERVENVYQSNPVVFGLGAAALAALGGALLPATRRENELFGEQADALKERSQQLLDETLDKAEQNRRQVT